MLTDADCAVPKGMTKVIVPANRYIHLAHEGSLEDIAKSFGAIYDYVEGIVLR